MKDLGDDKPKKKPSGWHPGDLGRYSIESKLRPRFETIRATKEEGVVVWYHMALKPQSIPVESFKQECTQNWSLKYVDSNKENGPPDLELTKRMLQVKPGDLFTMPRYPPLPWMTHSHQQVVDREDAKRTVAFIAGKALRVRQVRKDFCSCDVDDTLVLLPTAYLLRNDHEEVNLWSALLEEGY